MCFQLRFILIISFLWILNCSQQAFGCTSTTSQYKRSGDDVTIQFKARTVNSEHSAVIVSNQIVFNENPLISMIYRNGVNTYISTCAGCTFTGNAATGDLSIRLDNIQTSQGGTYKHSVTESIREVKGCVLVYILGKPTTPIIKVNKTPFEGESVTLTCSSTSTSTPRDPNLIMMFSWKADNNIASDTRFTFSATKNKLTISNVSRNDVNKQFTCTAKEDLSYAITSTSSESRKLNVYYKPDRGPLIQDISNNTLYYAIVDRQQKLTCSIIGGYPLPSISWSCFSGSGQDISSGQNVTKTWTWTARGSGTCKCTSTQMGYADTVVLDVRIISPPTSPAFHLHSQPVQPSSTVKILRDSIEPITCLSTSTPSPEYEWTYNGPTTEISQEATLSPSKVTQDGRYYCNVQNVMTPSQGNQEAGRNIAFIDIEVMYAPTVKPFDIEPIVEGSPLSVECKSDPGNPADTTYSWKRKLNSPPINSWHGIPDSFINGCQLYKPNITRNDAGIYKCTASNVMKPTAESQQKGSSFQTFLLTVLYPATITSFVIEGHTGKSNVILLDENDEHIQFTCEVNSNPVSTVRILFQDEIKKNARDMNMLLFKFSSVSCLDSGEYTCEGNNGIGLTSRKSIQLHVNCSPRPLFRINQNISSSLSMEATLSFAALAYPKPGAKGFAWYKRNGVNWTQVLANRDIRIISTALQSNLTILNITKSDYGGYQLKIINDFGAYIQPFNLAEKKVYNGLSDIDATCDQHETNSNIVVVRIALGIIIAILTGCVMVMAILYRWKLNRKEPEPGDQTSIHQEYVNVSHNAKNTDDQQKDNERNTVRVNNAPDENINQYMDLSEYSRNDTTTCDFVNTQML